MADVSAARAREMRWISIYYIIYIVFYISN